MFFKSVGYFLLAGLAVSASISFSPDYMNYFLEYNSAEIDVLEPFWGSLILLMNFIGAPYWLFHFVIVLVSLWIKDRVFWRHDYRVLVFYLATFFWLHDVVQIRLSLAISLFILAQTKFVRSRIGSLVVEILSFLTHPSILLIKVIQLSRKVGLKLSILLLGILFICIYRVDLFGYIENSYLGDTKIEFYLWDLMNNSGNVIPWKYLVFNLVILTYTIVVAKKNVLLNLYWLVLILGGFYFLPEVLANRIYELFLFTMLWHLRKVFLKLDQQSIYAVVTYIPTILLFTYIFTKGLRV